MRRFALLLAILTLAIVVPSPVAAAPRSCTIDVTPHRGTAHTTYRITGNHFPLSTDSPLEVDMFVSRVSFNLADLGRAYVVIYFVFLIPGGTHFYVDFNAPSGGEPPPPILPGRYLVQAFTPHMGNCNTSSVFVVH